MKAKDILVAYMPHIIKGNAIIKDVLERMDMPLKTGVLGKTPAKINNKNLTKKAHLEVCFGKFRRDLNDAITKFKLLKADYESAEAEVKKKIMEPFFNFSKAYLQIFTTLLSFKDKNKSVADCKPFSRVLKIAGDKDVNDFYEKLLAAHGVVSGYKSKVLPDADVEEVISYFTTVAALKDLEAFPQPPAAGGARRRRTVRRKRVPV